MSLVKNTLQNSLYQFALSNKFIIPAFNIFDIASARAVLDAAQEEDSPIIIQVSCSTHINLRPLDKFVRYLSDMSYEYDIPIMLHHDYLPTIEACEKAIDIGFQSVSFDGQNLPFEENADCLSKVVQYAHRNGVIAEGELGNVPGDGFVKESIYTDPEQAVLFCRDTSCDALAISVGTSHGGLRTDKPLEINYSLLDKISESTVKPLILHGAASRPKEYTDYVNIFGGNVEYLMMAPEESINEAGKHGVVKIYADIDNWLSVTGALREYFYTNPQDINPIKYLPCYEEKMKSAVKRKIQNVSGSNGYGHLFCDYVKNGVTNET